MLNIVIQCLINVSVFPKDEINMLTAGYSNTLTTKRYLYTYIVQDDIRD